MQESRYPYFLSRFVGVQHKSNPPEVNRYLTPWSRFWRGLLAEVAGTLLLVYAVCGSGVGSAQFVPPNSATFLYTGFIQGFAVLALVAALAHVSGGHLNPAVTVALLFAGKMPFVRALLYVIMQCAGAIAGAGLFAVSVPHSLWQGLGSTEPVSTISRWNAFFIEFMVTLLFTFVVVGTAIDFRSKAARLAAVPIGLSLGLGVMVAGPWTGGSLNPARSLGPALVSGNWHWHWVYWAGPLGGGLIAGLVWRIFFLDSPDPEEVKMAVKPEGPGGMVPPVAVQPGAINRTSVLP